MASHEAKRSALRKCYPDFVRAIEANTTALKYELYAEELITLEARNSGSADDIASSYENKLMYDESAWDKLIEVLRHRDGSGIIADRLTDRLGELLRGNAPGDNIPRGQQQNRGESPCYTRLYVIVVLHILALGKQGLFMEAFFISHVSRLCNLSVPSKMGGRGESVGNL